MKGRNLFLTGILAAVIGVLLILFRTVLADGGIVTAAGILFLVAGVLNVVIFFGSRDSKGNTRQGALATAFGWIASAAAVVLGLAMLIFKAAFAHIICFMFALLLLFAALFQFGLLVFGSRPVKLPTLYFIVPVLLVGAAVYVFMLKTEPGSDIISLIVTGSGFILFGVASMAQGTQVGASNRKAA